MVEHRFFDEGTTPFVSTEAYHALRARAPHLEQPGHQPRLLRTAELIEQLQPSSIVDLGCGDGGLLSLLRDTIPSWGYDFQPSNEPAWRERRVDATLRDVFNTRDTIEWGELAVLTEVLEHLVDPHGTVRWVAAHVRYVIASSPHGETPDDHDENHAWAWDRDGYVRLFDPYLEVLRHEVIDQTQIYVGQRREKDVEALKVPL